MERQLEQELVHEPDIKNFGMEKSLDIVYDKKKILADDEKKLRVYVDKTNNKYFIDVFAAFSLDIIPYKVATQLYDSGFKLYEISAQFLEFLKEKFGNNIEYYFINKKNLELEESYSEHPVENDYVDNNENKDNFKNSNNINDATHISYSYNNNFSKVEMDNTDLNQFLDSSGKAFNNYTTKKR